MKFVTQKGMQDETERDFHPSELVWEAGPCKHLLGVSFADEDMGAVKCVKCGAISEPSIMTTTKKPKEKTAVIQAAAPQKTSALVKMAERLTIEPEKLMGVLTETVFKGANPSELAALVVVANEYGLNPLTKQIYAFPQKGGIVPVVGIDGWLHIMNSHPQFDGAQCMVSTDGSEATCTIHRKDRKHPTVITEYADECRRNTEPWKSHPRRMLRHKAIIQCARVAFGLSGIYDEDEARDQIARIDTGEPKREQKPIFEEPPRRQRVTGRDGLPVGAAAAGDTLPGIEPTDVEEILDGKEVAE